MRGKALMDSAVAMALFGVLSFVGIIIIVVVVVFGGVGYGSIGQWAMFAEHPKPSSIGHV